MKVLDVGTGIGDLSHVELDDQSDAVVSRLPLMIRFGIATEEEGQARTLEQRLREEAARLQSVSMATSLMHVWTRLA